MRPKLDVGVLRATGLTLLLGLFGGVLFDFAGLPAAYLSGSMLAIGLAAMAGVNVTLPMPLRNAAFVLLGAVLGSTVNPDIVSSLPSWPISLVLLLVGLAVLLTVVPRYLSSVHGFDRATAKLCAVPGALSVVVALASDLSADVRRVALVQTSRLAVLMILIPLMAGLTMTIDAAGMRNGTYFTWTSFAGVLAASAAGVWIAQRVRLPAPFFVGALLFSGILFGTGTVEGQAPPYLLWPGLVVLGASIGVRFCGADLSLLTSSLKAGAGSTALAIALTGLFAWPAAQFLALPFLQIWLAFAPGGLEAMTVLAFSLGLDPAFVAGHQLFRFIALSLALPFIFRSFGAPAPSQ